MKTERPGRISSARPLPAPSAGPLLAVLAGLAVGIPSVVGVISYTAIIYSGPLAPHLGPGVALAMAGAAIMAALAAWWADLPGTAWGPTVATTLVIALIAAELAGVLRDADARVVQGSVVLTIALATVLVGLAKVAVGIARRGSSADHQLRVYHAALEAGADDHAAQVAVVDWLVEQSAATHGPGLPG